MPTITSRTFKSGNSEAVRLPKEVALGVDREVVIVRSGDVLTIYPKKKTIQEMVAELRRLPKPTSIGERLPVDIPERDGL